MRFALTLAAALIVVSGPHHHPRTFTLAGAGLHDAALADGRPAVFAPIEDPAAVAGLPDGSFVFGAEGAVWRVDLQGLLHRVAGQSEEAGYTGDGGPAVAAEVRPDHLAALPGGGFLIADETSRRVRRVAPDGTIATVAGGGTAKADGVPAVRVALADPEALAALPGGGFAVVDDRRRVREVTPDGLIRTVAGGGPDRRIHGEPATAATLLPQDIAVEPDGTLLIADPFHRAIDRVGADGTVHVAVRPPDGTFPEFVTALPGGGFAFAAEAEVDVTGRSARVYRVGPDGTITTVAGGGPFAAAPPDGLTQRGDGGPATARPLGTPVGLSSLPDGGLLLVTDPRGGAGAGDVVAYIPPDAPGVLAAALRRDAARVFRPGRAHAVHVVLTLPATVTLRADGREVSRALPAGPSTVRLPGLAPGPHALTLTASDAAGRGAHDRGTLFPAGWLPEDTARLVAEAVAPHRSATLCRRFAAGRVDCVDETEHDACGAISIRFAHSRVRWAAYHDCALERHPHYTRAPRRLRRRDWHCLPGFPLCRPVLFGRVRTADLVPER